jgi:hypothetical protein
MLRHHLDQLPCVQMIADIIGRNLDQAEARKRTRDIGFRAVDGDAALNRHCPNLRH